MSLPDLVKQITECQRCSAYLPLGPNPVVQLGDGAKILIIGQAPGSKVHHSSIPWNDPSGDRLRRWMNIDKSVFYDQQKIAIMPMGFCYPGKGKSGDLPPRSECAPLWHRSILSYLSNVQLTLLIGQYAQKYYLQTQQNLTETVKHWRDFDDKLLPLPHPSPRNRIWLARNPWFEQDLVPVLQHRINEILA